MTNNLFTLCHAGRYSYITQSLNRPHDLAAQSPGSIPSPQDTLSTKPRFKPNDINVHLCRHTELWNKEINPLTFGICGKKYLKAEILSTGEKK